MTLGVTRRERVAQRADKWWRSIYLKQMQMLDRGQVSEIIDFREPMVSYGSRPSEPPTETTASTDGRSVTNKTNGD